MRIKNLQGKLKGGFVPVWILVVLAIVATLGSGVAFFVLKGNLGRTSSTDTGTPPVDCGDCSTDPIFGAPPVSDPTADWKVYENAEWGFRFKYPGGWTIVEDDKSGGFGLIVAAETDGARVFNVYSNFFGGFECYENEESDALKLKSGESVQREVLRPVIGDGDLCGPPEEPDARFVLVGLLSIKQMGESSFITYSFNKMEAPDGLETLDLIIANFEVL